MSMLQSPKKRIQRHRRLTSVSENPILEAKQDTKRQQQQPKQRQQSNGTPYPTPSRQQGYQQQHQRQHSIPDALTLGSATAPSSRKSNANAYPPRALNAFSIENSRDQDQKNQTTIDNNINSFFASQLQRPRTPPSQANLSKLTIEFGS